MSSITQTALAELAGVSQNTVCRALHGAPGISPKTRKTIHDLAAAHGYRVNTAARNMRTGRTGDVGVLVLDSPTRRYVHPALLELTWGVNAGLDAAGYVTNLVRLSDVERPDGGEARIFKEHLLDGVIVANLLPDPLLKKVEQLVPSVVWLDTNIWRENDCLQRDEMQAARIAARALIEAGHKKILYFIRPETFWRTGDMLMSHYSGFARQRGLEIEASDAGVQLIPISVQDFTTYDFKAIEHHLAQGVGVFINRLSEARRLVSVAAHSLGPKWGIDYSVVSADDGADVEWWWTELSRVRFDRLAMGQAAAEMMVAKLNRDPNGVASRKVCGELIAGTSIRPR